MGVGVLEVLRVCRDRLALPLPHGPQLLFKAPVEVILVEPGPQSVPKLGPYLKYRSIWLAFEPQFGGAD